MILSQPVARRRRHQESLLTAAFDEVLGHDANPTGHPGQKPLRNSHRASRVRRPDRERHAAWRKQEPADTAVALLEVLTSSADQLDCRFLRRKEQRVGLGAWLGRFRLRSAH